MEGYWDKEYPTHIEVPEGYWVASHSVDYVTGEKDVPIRS
jgi:hypothetical protein